MESRILLLSSPFGVGHRGAARAVASRLSRLEGAEVEVLEADDLLSGTALFRAATGLEPLSSEREPLAARLDRADLVACFDPVAADLASVADGRKCAGVVTELDPDPAWFRQRLSALLVPDETAATTAQERGFPPARLYPVGLAACEAFASPMPSGELVRRLLPEGHTGPAILVAGAGMRPFELRSLLVSIRRVVAGCLLVADVGMDPEAYESVRELEGCRALGKGPDVSRWWSAADFVVTRPRPDMVSRAVAVGRPMALLEPSSPTEERVARAVVRRGIGLAVGRNGSLEHILGAVVTRKGELEERIATIPSAGTDLRIARLLHQLARTRAGP